MSSFKRSAAVWVLRQAARHAYESTARRRQDWSNPGPTGTGTGGGWAGGARPGGAASGGAASGSAASGAGSTGSGYQPADEQPSRAYSADSAYSARPRSTTMQQQMEELLRRAWPLVDTPANRERAARFIERMRTVANTPR